MGVGSDETHRYIQKHLCITMSLGDGGFCGCFPGLDHRLYDVPFVVRF
jgi:hypothetical protein